MKEDKYNEVSIPMEVEADGFITRPEQLERVSLNRAKPVEECMYPHCEECDKYHGHYCTVPIVVSKQQWLILEGKMWEWYKRMDDLENLVTDEILRSQTRDGITLHPATKEQEEALNYTLMEYIDDFGEDE